MPFIEIEEEPDFDAVYAALVANAADDARESASAEAVAREAVADYMAWEHPTPEEAEFALDRPSRWGIAERVMAWASLDMYDPHHGMPAVDVGHVHAALNDFCRGHGIPL